MLFSPIKTNMYRSLGNTLSVIATLCFATYFLQPRDASAQDGSPPVFLDLDGTSRRPELATTDRIRFLTTIDFPPFNFLDQTAQLAGFNVDLARAICDELQIVDKCEIQALPWAELEPALSAGLGEAVIAGWPINARLRSAFAFSDVYLQLPARFVQRLEAEPLDLTPAGMTGRRIGVVAGSAHEAMLRAYFPDARAVIYQRSSWMFDDLRAGKTDALFGDGMDLSFWLSGEASAGCCRFAGEPYLSATFLGEGMAVAVQRERADLAQAFTFALQSLVRDGRFAEIFARYFPRTFY